MNDNPNTISRLIADLKAVDAAHQRYLVAEYASEVPLDERDLATSTEHVVRAALMYHLRDQIARLEMSRDAMIELEGVLETPVGQNAAWKRMAEQHSRELKPAVSDKPSVWGVLIGGMVRRGS